MIQNSKLKILSWNIYMLPSIINPFDIKIRSELIAKNLKNSDFDIIVFQEAFNSRARSVILPELKTIYPYQIGPVNRKKLSLRINSGLWILSKFPLEPLKSIEFSKSKGWDILSRKGAVILRGNFNEIKFHLIGTHLDSGDYQGIRDCQYKEINELLIKPFKEEGALLIICGDFNTNKNDRQNYHSLLNTLEVPDYDVSGASVFTYDGINNDLVKFYKGKQSILDYIFCKTNKSIVKSINRTIHRISEKWGRYHKDLSDHYAIAAEIEF